MKITSKILPPSPIIFSVKWFVYYLLVAIDVAILSSVDFFSEYEAFEDVKWWQFNDTVMAGIIGFQNICPCRIMSVFFWR